MDLSSTVEQEQLVEAFSALYSKESSTDRVRAAEESGGHDTALWAKLREVGALDMAVDEDAGGWGASMTDLGLVAEQHGRHLGSAPLLEAQTACRLLSGIGSGPASELLERAMAGDVLVTTALRPPRGGVLRFVPSGAVADAVIFVRGDRLAYVEPPSTSERRPVRNMGSMPVADLAIDNAVTELASGPEVRVACERAVDEWMVLMAGALVGLGRRSLEIGVDYVRERHAFGVPIGSFQAISHGLADAATAVDGAGLLAREAAWAVDAEPGRASELAALAFAFAAESAREASYRSLHYHGGYGFMLEYDIQLFFRRAKAWPAQLGEPRQAYARAAERRLARTVGGA